MNADTMRLAKLVAANRYTIDDLVARTGFSKPKVRYHWRKIRTQFAPTNGLIAGVDPQGHVYGFRDGGVADRAAMIRSVLVTIRTEITRLRSLDAAQWQGMASQKIITKRLLGHLQLAEDELVLQLERLEAAL